MKCIDCGTSEHVIMYDESVELCLDCIGKHDGITPSKKTAPLKQVMPTRNRLQKLHQQARIQKMAENEQRWKERVDTETPLPQSTALSDRINYSLFDQINQRSGHVHPIAQPTQNKYGFDDFYRELSQYKQNFIGSTFGSSAKPKRRKR